MYEVFFSFIENNNIINNISGSPEEISKPERSVKKRLKGRKRKKLPGEAGELDEVVGAGGRKKKVSKYPLECPHCSLVITERKAKVVSIQNLAWIRIRKNWMRIGNTGFRTYRICVLVAPSKKRS